jgi:hypothetical protein
MGQMKPKTERCYSFGKRDLKREIREAVRRKKKRQEEERKKKFEKCKTEDKVLQKNAYSVLEKFCDGDKRTEDKTSSPSTSKDDVSSMIRWTLNG